MNLPLLRAFGKAYVLFYNQPHSEPRVNKIDLVKILIAICLFKVLKCGLLIYTETNRQNSKLTIYKCELGPPVSDSTVNFIPFYPEINRENS